MTPSRTKSAVRQQVRAAVKALTPEIRAAAAARGCSLLEQQAIWKEARSVLFYAPLPDELDLWPLLEDTLAAEKVVALPQFTPVANGYTACQIRSMDDLQPGKFGIREPVPQCTPVPLNQLDLVLVPGVAFDVRGHRLGRGRGFYDRLLALARGVTCGVAFDEQIVDDIPVEPHDISVKCLLTPTRWTFFDPRAVLE